MRVIGHIELGSYALVVETKKDVIKVKNILKYIIASYVDNIEFKVGKRY